jgi:amino acid transporter
MDSADQNAAEEIKNASETLPRSITTGVAVNGILGFVMVVTLCFTVNDVNAVIATPTGYPFIQVFFNTTQSYTATNVMTTIIIAVLISGVISVIATSSRQLWSFARDGGLPFSSTIAIVSGEFISPLSPLPHSPALANTLAQVKPGWNIPLNAVCITVVITIILSLINIGSTVALLAITTLSTSALLCSYTVSISCVLLKRIRGQPLPPHRWSLGRFGMAINIAALCFLCPLFVFVFFPLTTPVVPSTMNWSSLMFGGMILFATVYYLIYGRKQYTPPVFLVKREE